MYRNLKRAALLVSVIASLLAVGLSLSGIGQAALAETPQQPEDRNIAAQEDIPVPAEQTAPAAETQPTAAPESTDAKTEAPEHAGALPGRHWKNPGYVPEPDTQTPAETLSGAIEDAPASDNAEESVDSSAFAAEEEEEPAPAEEASDAILAPTAAEEAEEEAEEEDDGFVYYTGIYRPDLRAYLPLNFPRELQEHTYEMAKKYGVSYEIMLGLFGVESGWNLNLYNYDGTCYGLGMLNIAYSRNYYARMGIDMMTPEGNIEASCEVLASKLKDFDGNLNYALMAYNAGTGGAWGMISCGVRANYYSNSIICFSENLISEAEWLEMQK